MSSSVYQVAVGSFEGPFDALLHLIAQRKLDIHEISLAEITDDYLAVLRAMEELDLEVTTDFLVIAATLLELKAARLLPGEDDPETVDLAVEARDLLYARLLDYRTFKRAAAEIGERLRAHAGYVPRRVSLEDRYTGLVPDTTLRVTPDGLAEIAARALAERPEPQVDVSHLQPVRMTIRQAAGMLADELERANGEATFAELTAGCRHRIELVVCFLALLELYKLQCVDIEQGANFGRLDVRWREETGTTQSRVLAALEGEDAATSEDVEAEPATEETKDGFGETL